MMRVAIYIRVSTEEQATEGHSIEGQTNILTDYCLKQNYTIYKVYGDEGITGTSIKKRLAIQQLIEDSKHDLFDMVLVWKFNRLARKQLDFLSMLDDFEKHSIKVYSYSENVDASTPIGKMFIQMLGSFAEFERNQTVENVKMGMIQRASEGYWNGGSMLGYTSKNKELVIVESEAEIVRYIFSLYIEGRGFKAIANKLNHEGYKTKRGAHFSLTSVRQIITNPAYAGFIRFNKQTDWEAKRRKGTNPDPLLVQGKHEPIISRDTWYKAHSILESKSHKPAKTFTGHYPLTTLLRCPACGQGMIGHRSKGSGKRQEYIRYYMCGNAHYKGSAVCGHNLVRADYAEEYVYNKLEEVASNKALLALLVQRVNSKSSHPERTT